MRIFSIVVLLLALATALPALVAGDFEDDSDFLDFQGVQGSSSVGLNQGTEVHTCYNDGLLRGLNSTTNQFMCTAIVPGVGSPYVDVGVTQVNYFYKGGGHPVHVCPSGSAMIGYHKGNNWLICAPTPGLTNLHVDLGPGPGPRPATPPPGQGAQESGMHVCNGNDVMVGISDADNAFICADHP